MLSVEIEIYNKKRKNRKKHIKKGRKLYILKYKEATLALALWVSIFVQLMMIIITVIVIVKEQEEEEENKVTYKKMEIIMEWNW